MTLRRHPGVELISSELAFRGAIFDVVDECVRLPSGLEQHVSLVDHPGAVAIAARCEDGELLLVRQYRHATGSWLLEVPAGRLEPGEDPARAARRELDEETGHGAGKLELLRGFFPAPGFCSERIWLFLAEELTPLPRKRPHDADEELEVIRMRPEAILAGDVTDGKTLLAALCLLNAAR